MLPWGTPQLMLWLDDVFEFANVICDLLFKCSINRSRLIP